MNCGIYLIVNSVNGHVFVGSSKILKQRRSIHWSLLRKGRHNNPHLQRAVNAYGLEAFAWEVLEYCDEADRLKREDWWMELLDSRNPGKGYNMQAADRPVMSAATRAKMSATRTGKPRPSEMGQKLAALYRGRKLSEEQKAQLAPTMFSKGNVPWNIGKKATPEARAHQSAGHQGKPWTEAQRAARQKDNG